MMQWIVSGSLGGMECILLFQLCCYMSLLDILCSPEPLVDCTSLARRGGKRTPLMSQGLCSHTSQLHSQSKHWSSLLSNTVLRGSHSIGMLPLVRPSQSCILFCINTVKVSHRLANQSTGGTLCKTLHMKNCRYSVCIACRNWNLPLSMSQLGTTCMHRKTSHQIAVNVSRWGTFGML